MFDIRARVRITLGLSRMKEAGERTQGDSMGPVIRYKQDWNQFGL